ncbi:Cold shock domain-containing protein [Chionoecetes opilio]|uniref:Cold shock domain-containing protein n=1 Tax=Chionoecetes opilio TaxID=41210 RepID=A0A8J4XUF7_CHIOP|nr:Cold shock domain-containing protein [Chionoecetes opilio]
MSSPGSNTPDSPNKRMLQIPSPIVTRRTRTKSTSEIAFSNPEVKGKVRYFCRSKGHGFIVPENGTEEIFLHISDIEGEYVPQEGDEVNYRLCPIPPKREKCQATHVQIVNFTPEVHLRWDCKPIEETH